MNLADHLRPLLRDHDCVIIPDFGGLVAEYTSARVQPGSRHQLSPPTRQVAFNQALTRNDGLLVDALCQQFGLPAAEAREALRQAVAALYRDLQEQQRTELPGIGVFRQLAGRGLQFEYTGANDLLPAVFGLPELTVLPVSVIDARLAREQQAQLVPRLRSAGSGLRLRRVVPGAAIGLLAGLAVAGLYLFNLHPNVLPTAWQSHVPRWEQGNRPAAPQQAALAQPSFALPAAEPLVSVPVAPVAEAPATIVPAAVPAKLVVATSVAPKPEAQPVKASEAIEEMAAMSPVPVALAATPSQTAPPQTVDPVDAMLKQRSLVPSPIMPRPRGKARKLPPAAAIAVANESNVARPIPMAMRKAGTPTLITTSYAAARTAAPLPVTPASSAAPAAVAPINSAAAPKVVAAKAAVPAKVKAAAPAKAPARAAWPMATKAKPVAPTVAKAKMVVPTVAKAKMVAPKAKTVVPVAVKKALVPAIPATEGAINTRTGRYFLVVAAYDSRARAEQGRRNLLHAGHANAKIIMPYPGTRHYRLSAADYADRPTAQMAANQLRKNPRVDNGLTVFPY